MADGGQNVFYIFLLKRDELQFAVDHRTGIEELKRRGRDAGVVLHESQADQPKIEPLKISV
jgi:hypothetical protein